MRERETVREDECQRTRDTVDLAQHLGQGHVPGPDPDLDRRTVNVDGLLQNHGPDPDPGKGGKIMDDCNNHLCPPEIRWSHCQKTRGNAGPDQAQAQERGGKMKDHPEVHKKPQDPVLHPLKTQSSYKTRKKMIPFEAH